MALPDPPVPAAVFKGGSELYALVDFESTQVVYNRCSGEYMVVHGGPASIAIGGPFSLQFQAEEPFLVGRDGDELTCSLVNLAGRMDLSVWSAPKRGGDPAVYIHDRTVGALDANGGWWSGDRAIDVESIVLVIPTKCGSCRCEVFWRVEPVVLDGYPASFFVSLPHVVNFLVGEEQFEESELDLIDVSAIYNQVKISKDIVGRINPELEDFEKLKADLDEIGYENDI